MVVVEEDRRRKRRKKVTNKGVSILSDIWLLQAKKWTNDTRDTEATESLQVYLLPDRPVRIGKNRKLCDMVVPGDNTVSGKHATVCVKKDEDSGSYVEVSDCSRLGTVVTKANDFKTGRFIEDAVVAHDWWYILFGYRSPFQVRRINVSIHFNKGVLEETDGKAVASKAGIPVVEELSAVKGMHLVVGPDPCHPLDEKILLAALLNIPVVRLGWLEAWSSQLWIGEGPQKHAYGVTLVHEGKTLAEPILTRDAQIVYRCNFMYSQTTEKAEILSCSFVWPWGSLSKELQEAMSIVGIHIVETSMDECSLACKRLEKPVVIVQSTESETLARDLLISVDLFCFLSDLMALVFDGTLPRLLRPLSELRGRRAQGQSPAMAPDDDDGWHTVCRNESGAISEQEECILHEEDDTCNKESSAILFVSGKKRFVKAYAPSNNREVIPLVQADATQHAPAFEEWAEQERHRMDQKLKDDAFDMHGVKKPRNRKQKK